MEAPAKEKTISYRQIPHGGRVFTNCYGSDIFIGYRASQFTTEEELHWPLVTKREGHIYHWPASMAKTFHGFVEAA